MGDSYRQSMKIFIGGLSFETTDEALKRYFEHFGVVTDAIVMKDSVSRRSRGFGFITYSSAASVEAALSVEQHIVDNRRVEAKRAVPRSEVAKVDSLLTGSPLLQPAQPAWDPGFVVEGHMMRGIQEQRTRSNSSVSGGSMGGGTSIDGAMMINKIFVGGLHYETRDASLRAYFEQFGRVVMAEVMFNRETHKSRGFGFVVFETEEAANAVLQSTHHTVNGKIVEVKRAVPRSQASTGGSSGPSSPALMGFGPPGQAGVGTSGQAGPFASQKSASKRAQRARAAREAIGVGGTTSSGTTPVSSSTLPQQRFAAANSYAAALRYGGGHQSHTVMSPQSSGKPPQHHGHGHGHLQGREDMTLHLQSSHGSRGSTSAVTGVPNFNQPFGPGGPLRTEAVSNHTFVSEAVSNHVPNHAFVQHLKAMGAKNAVSAESGDTFDHVGEPLTAGPSEHRQHVDMGLGDLLYSNPQSSHSQHGLVQGAGQGQGQGGGGVQGMWSSVSSVSSMSQSPSGRAQDSGAAADISRFSRSGGGERALSQSDVRDVRFLLYENIHDSSTHHGHGGGLEQSPLFTSRALHDERDHHHHRHHHHHPQWQPLTRGMREEGSSLSTPVGGSPRLLGNNLLENAIAELSLDRPRGTELSGGQAGQEDNSGAGGGGGGGGGGSGGGSGGLHDGSSGVVHGGGSMVEGQNQLPLLFPGLGGGGPPSTSSDALAYGRAGGERAVDTGGLSGGVGGSSLWRADAFGSALSVNVTSTAGDAGGPAPGHGAVQAGGGRGAPGEGKDLSSNSYGAQMFNSSDSGGLDGLRDMLQAPIGTQTSSSGVGRGPAGLPLELTGHRSNNLASNL
ncbi:unnamed protein product [Discosporangium mesarthrocarpum]